MSIYLYIKTHKKTGLKYLGYTKKDQPDTYKGSGKYWKLHCDKHGWEFDTEILKECQSKDEIKEWGIYYSNLFDVVNARDNTGKKIWANLKPETGPGGGYLKGTRIVSEETKLKMSIAAKNRAPMDDETKKKISKSNTGKIPSEEKRKKIAEANTGKVRTEEAKQNIKIGRSTQIRKPHSKETKQKMSEKQKGRTLTEEHKKKLSEAAKQRKKRF